ncbi:MAG: putative ribosomal RNA small subunit methyltransferase A [Candidatus Syntrophoarchaeum sp. GoM_oil]|nr:MAG: putative ribosomal RNA small subunit methyltransferase A [Candidatus Syntrophoarchaeum sp. GoM_oil]
MKKSERDQHFLVDEKILDEIVEYGNLKGDDRVLEIGAGAGNLTERLVERSEKVYAIEIDSRLSDVIKRRCEDAEVINADVLKIEFPEFDKVISNLPYSISSKITLKILRSNFKMGILMYQAEFVKRITASPGRKEYGRIAVSVQALADVEVLEDVPREAFDPVPEVRSVLIRLRPKRDFRIEDKDMFLNFVMVLFSNRRKKIKKTLKALNYDITGLAVDNFLNKRPDELEVSEIVELYEKVSA